MSNFQRLGRKINAAGLALALISGAAIGADEVTYIMLDDGSLRLSDGRSVSTSGYHAMPDGSLMMNDGTPLFEPGSAVPTEQMAVIDHSQHAMSSGDMADATTGSHAHHHAGAGTFMFQYHYMHMAMRDLIHDSEDTTANAILVPNGSGHDHETYMMSPTNMKMDMHMLMAMVGMTDNLTFMTMFNYVKNDMTMLSYLRDNMGMITSSTLNQVMASEGMGDTDVSLIFKVSPMLTTSLALSIPTGDINQRSYMVMNNTSVNVVLPYSMQLGSGTYDLKPAINYASGGKIGVGGMAQYTYRIGTNNNGYTLGNRIDTNAWLKLGFNKNSNVSLKLGWSNISAIKGQNTAIPTEMEMAMGGSTMHMLTTPLANPANYGGNQIDWMLGFSGTSRKGSVNFNMGVGAPIYQSANGLQMKNRMILSSALNYMF